MRNPNPRNYRKNPHTARFLQKFHSGTAGLPSDLDPTSPEVEAARSFVKGRSATFAQPTASDAYFKEIGGFNIRLGSGLLTEPQARFVADIANTRQGVTEEMRKSLAVRLEQGFAKRAASDFISTYKDLPRGVRAIVSAPAAFTVIPDGWYAIQLPSQDKPHFYRVTAGRKPGVIFVNEQASDETYPVRNPNARKEILAEIAKDVEKAGMAYATLLSSCRKCGRTLTDHNNPYFGVGLGPDCGKK